MPRAKHPEETWGSYGFFLAERYGLQREFLDYYAANRNAGLNDRTSACHALYDWDLYPLDGMHTAVPVGDP